MIIDPGNRETAWNEGKKASTVAMHPDDISALGLCAGRQVRMTTEVGSEVGELEMSSDVRQGTVLIPHDFGLVYAGEVCGINVNRLTKNSRRDLLAPLYIDLCHAGWKRQRNSFFLSLRLSRQCESIVI